MRNIIHNHGPKPFPTAPLLLLLLLSPLVGCGQLVGWALPCTDCDPDTAATDDTADTAETIAPTVWRTIPADGATDVGTNDGIIAIFDEVMDPLSLTTDSFTLFDGTQNIEGIVTQFGVTAIFYPSVGLTPHTDYVGTITTEAADRAGNTLATDFVWAFQTGAGLDLSPPTIIVTDPLDLQSEVANDVAVNATFSEAMDPRTVTPSNFSVVDPDGNAIPGAVVFDASGFTSTFTPESQLLPDTTYTATISATATDLVGNAMEQDYIWGFSTAGSPSIWVPVDLGSLSNFVAASGAGLTSSNSSGTTTLNGDVALSPTATCLGDGIPCTLTNPVINGTLYANDSGGIAAQAKVDLTAAYIDAMARPRGVTVNDVTGLTLPPGVYTSDSSGSIAVGGTVVLDAEGDPDAVWVFQIGSSLTVNNDAQVLLVNGAQAKNVFWAVFASSTLGSNVSFQGSILAGASNSVGTDSTVVGRLLCTTGAITLLSNTITLPPL